MKKLLAAVIAAALIVSLTACAHPGKTEHVSERIGASTKFSQEEIRSAMDCVKKKFRDFKGCELTDLWYDEAKSDQIVPDYLKHGRGALVGATAENTIVLLSNFKTGPSSINDGFNPNSSYTDWIWILIRDNENADWKADDWGVW